MAGAKGRSGGKRKGAGRKAAPVSDVKKFEQIENVYTDMQTCENKDLPFPAELDGIPMTREIWEDVLSLDKQSKYPLLNARHKEILKSYCYSVAMRNELIRQLKGDTLIYKKGEEIKVTPVLTAVDKLDKMIRLLADDLGLTVLSSYKMAVMAKNGESLDGKADEGNEDSDDDLFD